MAIEYISRSYSEASGTLSHVVTSATDFLVVVAGIQWDDDHTATWNGTSMTLAARTHWGGNHSVAIWYLRNPDIGTYNVAIQNLHDTNLKICAINFKGVLKTGTPIRTTGGANGNAVTTLSMTMTGQEDDVSIDALYITNNRDWAPGSGQSVLLEYISTLRIPNTLDISVKTLTGTSGNMYWSGSQTKNEATYAGAILIPEPEKVRAGAIWFM